MVLIPVYCPHCGSDQVVKYEKAENAKQRYLCQQPEYPTQTFISDYEYQDYLPEVKKQIIDMVLNGSGIRDTAWVLEISPTTVISELKKESCLESVNRAVLKRLNPSDVIVDIQKVEDAELDEITDKTNQNWYDLTRPHQSIKRENLWFPITSRILIAVLIVVVTALLGATTNIVANRLPDAWQPYLWLAWPITVACVFVLIVLVIWQYNTSKREKPNLPNSTVVFQGNVTGSFVVGNENIVTTIVQGISEEKFNRAESDRYKDLGRAKVQQWGERLNRENYWDWNLLGHAIDYYADAIRRDPKNQHPWTNLAYVLHLVGEEKKAYQCLAESYKSATPGPNHPGNNYKQVKKAVDNDEYLTGGGKVDRPPVPDWFWGKHGRLPIH